MEERWSRWDERGYVAIVSRLTQAQRRRILSKKYGRRVLKTLQRKWNDAQSRNALLAMLFDQEIQELDTDVRVDFIHALQKGRTSLMDEERIVQLICSTRSKSLENLKNGLEQRGYHNLHSLVYHELSPLFRDRVCAHFLEHDARDSKIRVICDIDDTVYASWKDEKFPKKTVYPGVKAFLSCLAHRPQDLVFLTARPRDRGHVSERLTRRRLLGFGFEHPIVLVGRWHQVHSDEAILDRKWTNITQYHSLYPHDRFMFLGDSGQLDVVLAQKMAHSGLLCWAGIHEIEPQRSIEWKSKFPELSFFYSYTQAAILAWKQGVIDKEQALFVCEESRKELMNIPNCDKQRWEEWKIDHSILTRGEKS